MQKIILLIALFAISSFTFARELPPNQCFQGSCSEAQEEIYKDFNNGVQLDLDSMPVMTAGSCYHIGRGHDNSKAQNGGFLFDKKDGYFYMSGRLGFMQSENRYATWDLEEARRQFPKRYNKERILKIYDDYSFIDLNPGKFPMILYWFRKDIATDDILVVAVWGTTNRFFCRLKANQ
jgi:hypothetical protein